MIQAINISLMLALAVMAVLCWHRGIPSVLPEGRGKAIELFLLGVVLAFYAVGRLNSFIADPDAGLSIYITGHLALLAYAVMRYRRLLK